MMALGIDIGYFATKAYNGSKAVTFPSLVGSPGERIFSLDTTGAPDILLTAPLHCRVGDSVLSQSLWERRRQDRGWWRDTEWQALLLAALSELVPSNGTSVPAALVLGLPVSWVAADTTELREQVLGDHRFQRAGDDRRTVTLADVRVLPQGVGIAMDAIFDAAGQVVQRDLFDAHLAVVDIGGNTVNLVELAQLRAGEASASRPIGTWRAVTALRRLLAAELPDLELRDHELAGILAEGVLSVDGRRIELHREIAPILDDLADAVIAHMTQLWAGARRFDRILIGGGGAHLVGERIAARYPQARIIEDPQLANARGYWRFARRIAAAASHTVSQRVNHNVTHPPLSSGSAPSGLLPPLPSNPEDSAPATVRRSTPNG